MAKPKKKRLITRKEDPPRLPRPTKKRRYRARWRPHEIVFW
jgi:hypothetical protein